MCSYNGEKFIEEQIKSILNQENVDVSLRIIDDKSTDDTINIVKKIDDERIKLIINKENSGSPALNFTKALMLLDDEIYTEYDFISLSDQDDLWFENKLFKAIELLRLNKSDLYTSNLTFWNLKSNSKSLLRKDYSQTDFDYLFEGASAGCTYVLTTEFTKALIQFVYKYDLSKWTFLSHDWLIYFCARVLNFNVFFDSNSYILYRIHDTNVHGQLNNFSLYALSQRLKLILNGWYFIQSCNFSQLLNGDSEELYIYKMYNKNWFTRTWLIFKYNFKLIRSRTKFMQFALVSLIPRFQRFTL